MKARPGAWRLAAFFGLSVAWLLLSCGSASAHARLTETYPTNEETLAESPEQVQLLFSEPIEAEFNPLKVYDQQGNRADEDDARVDPDDARVLVGDLKELPVGTYTAEWRVTSLDGHVVEDAFNFTVTASDVSELQSDDAGTDVEGDVDSGLSLAGMAIIGLLGLSLIAALGVVLQRRR